MIIHEPRLGVGGMTAVRGSRRRSPLFGDIDIALSSVMDVGLMVCLVSVWRLMRILFAGLSSYEDAILKFANITFQYDLAESHIPVVWLLLVCFVVSVVIEIVRVHWRSCVVWISGI